MGNRKIFLLIMAVVTRTLITSEVFSQAEGYLARLESMRIAFFTERLDLSSAEAEKFWPVYRDYNNRKEKINADRQIIYRYTMKNGDFLSEQEVNESLKNFTALQKEEYSLFELYHQKFLEILPAKKVLRIYAVENQFKAHILNQIRDARSAPPQGRRRNF